MTLINTPFLPLLACTLFLAEPPSVNAQHSDTAPPRPADPYADPANDPYNPLRYIASNSLTAVASILLLLTALAQTWLMRKMGAKYMLVAEYTFTAGIALRFALHANPESIGIYIIEYLLVILSPCGFIAADYVLLGRISMFLECGQYLLISPQRITLVFVLSDVVTFLLQIAGGSLTISKNASTAKLGRTVFLGGLGLQLASFILFMLVFVLFLWRIYTLDPTKWHRDSHEEWYNDWRALAGALGISCVGITIRSVYRLIELSEGYFGKLATTEGYFYGLDTLPLFIAISIYTPFWPGRFIPAADNLNIPQRLGTDKVELDRLRSRRGPYNVTVNENGGTSLGSGSHAALV